VVEASYGLNCHASGSSNKGEVQPGNVTRIVADACNGLARCVYLVDVAKLGDPAPACAKDMTVRWTCGSDPTVEKAYLKMEASGKTIVMTCERHL
jgi:hypothetical protein